MQAMAENSDAGSTLVPRVGFGWNRAAHY